MRNSPALTSRLLSPRREPDLDRLRHAVHGKTILVTGASFGLGEATARALAAAEAQVLLTGRTSDRLQEVAASVTAAGGRAVVYPADLADPAAADDLAQRITREHGALDVIVNNAGKSLRRSLELQYDRPQDFQRTIAINYLGPIRLLLGLLPAMRQNRGGQIVNISTIGVRIAPGPRWGAYQASKGAFDIWLRSVAPELHRDRVAVSSIYMALIHTRMSAPTPIMRKLPGLNPDEAADVVAKAIIERPRSLAPWWAAPANMLAASIPGPIDKAMRLMHRFSDDSDSARRIDR
ncbi:SDR family NAD(P)-dependent oxidoreductase [Mycobacteroides chelonae]|jgi:NAD(P)-dependent dehydrogenase (short-subunit alcohol dehydrogenase family)|uniref:Epimerase n=1 Tax=Mycobacteroides chelonae TaxID=1774 RepID=A0AB73MZS4_MYCCH|nr:SDR family NAD(P)-dependent oxidoreductase [Mycobacteroides chelonae]MBF9315254.1 SDR family NAD(P)-dependent oxidoreductase [Mycobacteroides chelonae]MBF9326618.1 SDR family NAD(P)-dependent oxidoreductase [Mycobacteroides chelonae]MBF9420795.1 SDR family NAD(P)-dependent oxidoreductase [Mycobacteroides chelonae]MBF9437014.1 SDR family NAD(P)-dependent oxidoreductase [Mycobacteroides chelonae]MBV6360697.1 SDR family NAD(P)-dependent oxidoreductase [Mycobacteroides chelonae]